MLVWCRAKLSFWKICGTDNQPPKGFALGHIFGVYHKCGWFLESRGENSYIRLCVAQRIKFQIARHESEVDTNSWCSTFSKKWQLVQCWDYLGDPAGGSHPDGCSHHRLWEIKFQWLVETVEAKPCLVEQYFTSAGAKREISRKEIFEFHIEKWKYLRL